MFPRHDQFKLYRWSLFTFRYRALQAARISEVDCSDKMAAENVYKVLFFVQSVAFTLFIMHYAQTPTTLYKPIQKLSADSHCEWKPNETRHVFVTARPTVSKTVDKSPVLTAIRRGPLSNCSLADVKKRPGVVLLTTANLAYVDVVLNMLTSVKRVGVCINTTVIAEDRKAYNLLLKHAAGDPAVHVQLTNSGEMDAIEHARSHRSQYYGVMNKRQAYVLSLLKQGMEVLFTDADTFWFRDPFPHFRGDFDMRLRSSGLVRTVNKTSFCAGFIYLKPTNATIRFVTEWVKVQEDHRKRGSYPADQNVMNRLLRADKPVHVDIKPLDPNLFPWGPNFFNQKYQKANHPTVVMHAASIRGHPAKLSKFKTYNMWLVNNLTTTT